MKFYFCEKCGTRLTESDIDAGQARNKKLRGVFCQNCAVGVMTLETMPLDEAAAQEILRGESSMAERPPVRNGGTGRGRRRTSAIRQIDRSAPRQGPRREHAPDAPPPPTDMPGPVQTLGWMAGVVVMLGLGAAFFLLRGDTPAPPHASTSENEIAADGMRINAPRPAPVVIPPAVAREPSMPEPTEPAIETPVSEPDPAPQALPPVADTPEEPEAAPEHPAPTPVAAAVPEVEAPPPYDPAPLLGKMVEALRRRQPDGAQQALKAAPDVPEDVRAQCLAALAWPTDVRTRFHEALKTKLGETVELSTAKETWKGVLSKLEPESAWISTSFVINGRKKEGPARRVLLQQVTLETQLRFAPVPEPLTPESAFALALQALGEGDGETAQAALFKAAGHPLMPSLSAWFEQQKTAQLEEDALGAWTAWVKGVDSCATAAQAGQLKKNLAAYDARFGNTAHIKRESYRLERAAKLELLEQLTMGLDPRIAKLFRGVAKSFDPRTQIIEVHYDLADKAHLKDFVYTTKDPARKNQRTYVVESEQGVALHCGSTIDRELAHPAFAAGSVSVQGVLESFRPTADGYRFGVEFGLPDSSGKAAPLVVQFYRHGGNAHTASVVQFLTWLKVPQQKSVRRSDAPADKDTFHFACEGKQYVLKLNDSEVMSYEAPEVNDRAGVTFIVGRSTGLLMRHIVMKGRLDPAWLRKKLK